MFTTILPSIHALSSPDDALLDEELRVVMLRSQAAAVRTLLDEVDLLVRISAAAQRARSSIDVTG